MPAVTVVTATYHRPEVLVWAVRTALAQTVRDIEVIIVGDHCTDGTAAAVAGLGDARARFHNLERNVGEQSGPNNAGVELARSGRVAFLNHDDLWFPDHLERSLEALERGRADLAFALGVSMRPDGSGDLLAGVPAGVYDPRIMVPATGWVFDRTLQERVGPWRRAAACWVIPSQDWLHRAHRRGARLVAAGHLGFLAVQSAYRPGCYTRSDDTEHAALAGRMAADPRLREDLLASCAGPSASAWRTAGARRHALGVLVALVARATAWTGAHPDALRELLCWGRRGGRVRALRRTRGLPPHNGP